MIAFLSGESVARRAIQSRTYMSPPAPGRAMHASGLSTADARLFPPASQTLPVDDRFLIGRKRGAPGHPISDVHVSSRSLSLDAWVGAEQPGGASFHPRLADS